MVHRSFFSILSLLPSNQGRHISTTPWLDAYGSPTHEPVSLNLVPCHLSGVWTAMDLIGQRIVRSQDGAGNVKLSSRREHTIARFVPGKHVILCLCFCLSSDWRLQMRTKDGSPLPVDCQLRLSSHLSTFLSFPVLCSRINDLSRIFHLYPPRCHLGGTWPSKCMCSLSPIQAFDLPAFFSTWALVQLRWSFFLCSWFSIRSRCSPLPYFSLVMYGA